MQFLFPSLTIGFALLAVPLLVHLINVLRQRKRKWAAMEFLMASYRKQRKWIWLRQFLLLLVRTVAIALLVAMLAGWVGRGRWLDALGGRTNHHIVVLDDSLSMSDASGGTTAYRRALGAIESLNKRLGSADGTHQLTILRTSRAMLVVEQGSNAGDAAADVSAQTIGPENRTIDRLMASRASSLEGGIAEAVDLATALENAASADRTVLYILSDLRASDWASPERINSNLQELGKKNVELRIVDCGVTPGANLGITKMEPTQDVWVAGVPTIVEATVKNYGSSVAKNVTLDTEVIKYGQNVSVARTDLQYSGETEPLPGMVFEEIKPGAEVTKKFQVFVPQPGTHAITATIPDDVLSIDNTRSCTLPLTPAQNVLVIDGKATGEAAYFVSSVLNPGGQIQTGAVPDVRGIGFLNSVGSDELARYRAIYMLDVPRIDDTAARKLSGYVSDGGGLALFLGQEAQRTSYNETFAKHPGILPGMLGLPKELPLASDPTPDLVPSESHELVAPLQSAGDGVFGLVRVALSLDISVDEGLGLGTETVIRRRDDVPYVLSHKHGNGRVITVLSGLDNQWTNWTGDPTFVIFLLRANAYLWATKNPSTSRIVIDPIAAKLRGESYGRSAELLSASFTPPRLSIRLQAQQSDEGKTIKFQASPGQAAIDRSIDLPSLLQPGIFEWWLTRTDGSREVRPVASVISGNEGALERSRRSDIARVLRPTVATFFDSSQMADADESNNGGNRASILLALLALALIIEQVLAYFGSYHPPVGAKA